MATGHLRPIENKKGKSWQIVLELERDPVTGKRERRCKTVKGSKKQVNYETALAFIRYSGIAYIKVGNRYRVAEEHLNKFLLRQGHKDVPLQ